MMTLNIHEAKTHLSRYLKRVAAGETIILCKRNVPIAKILPIAGPRRTERPIGLARGQFQVLPEFFEPLPHNLQNRLNGTAR